MEDELNKDEINELSEMSVWQVDLVGRPANRRPWLLLKSDDELPDEVVDALLKEEDSPDDGSSAEKAEASTKDWAEVDKAKLPAACFLWVEDPEKKATWHLPYREGAGEVGEDGMYSEAGPVNINGVKAAWAAVMGGRTGEKMEVPDEVMSKLKALREDLWVKDETEKSEGGERDMSEEELKKAIERVTELEKAVKDAEDAKTEALRKAAEAEAIIKGQKKAARARELEGLCKSAGLDFEAVYKAEETDAEGSKVLLDAIKNLVKQVDAALGNESGSARKSDASPREKLTELTQAYAAEHPDVPFNKAAEIVRKAHPDLVKEA